MSNLHLLLDEANKHTPKGFDNVGAKNYRPWKDELSESTYTENQTLPRAINFVDGTAAAPTSANGDIYVLTGAGVIDASWGTSTFGDWTRATNTIFNPITPIKGILCYDDTASQWMEFDGSVWAAFGGAGTTNLGIANITATNLDVTSDTGTDATVPAATASDAGLMPSAKFNEVVANNAKDSRLLIKEEGGSALTTRTNLNFIGASVTATDNAGTDSTDITIVAGSPSGVFGVSDAAGVYTYYATLDLAHTGASNGDVIEMFANATQATKTTITKGVNIVGHGHELEMTGADYLIDLNSPGSTFKISNISLQCLTAGALGIVITSANTTLYMDKAVTIDAHSECLKVNATAKSYGGTFSTGGAGTAVINVGGDVSDVIISNCFIALTSDGGNITNVRIEDSDTGIDLINGAIARRIYCYSSGIAIRAKSSSEVYNSTGISSISQGCNGDPGVYWEDTTAVALAAIAWGGIAVGVTQRMVNCKARGLVGRAAQVRADIIGGEFISLGTYALEIYQGSVRNAHIESKGAGVGDHAIFNFLAGKIFVNCTLKVANAAANCINTGGGAYATHYGHNSYEGATVPVDPAIVQSIVGVEDGQGNLVIF